MLVMAAAMVFFLVVMLVMTAAVMFFLVMVMCFLFQQLHFLIQRCAAVHCADQLLTGQLIPGSGHNGRLAVMLPQQGHRAVELGFIHTGSAGQNDGGRGFDLIVVELTEITHIHLYLGGIRHRYSISQLHLRAGNLAYSSHHIGQLAHTGGLDQDPVGGILLQHLLQRLAKVTYQRAADTAGVHFRHLNACLLHKRTVNADLTEFIFDQHQLLSCVALGDQLFDQCGLAGAQEAGENIDLCHSKHLL